jgi:hypothetical protein
MEITWSETHTPGFTTFYIKVDKPEVEEMIEVEFPVRLGGNQVIIKGEFWGFPRYELRRGSKLIKVLDYDEVVEFHKYAQ